MAPRKTYTIPVSKKMLVALEAAKGDRSWDAFLKELHSAWAGQQPPSGKVAPEKTGAPVAAMPFRDATGSKMDVMKAWSMQITDDGIQVEEIPHYDPDAPVKETKPKRPTP